MRKVKTSPWIIIVFLIKDQRYNILDAGVSELSVIWELQ